MTRKQCQCDRRSYPCFENAVRGGLCAHCAEVCVVRVPEPEPTETKAEVSEA